MDEMLRMIARTIAAVTGRHSLDRRIESMSSKELSACIICWRLELDSAVA